MSIKNIDTGVLLPDVLEEISGEVSELLRNREGDLERAMKRVREKERVTRERQR